MTRLFLSLTISCAVAQTASGQAVSVQDAQPPLAAQSTDGYSATTQPTSKPIEAAKKPDRQVIFVISTGGSMLSVFGDAKTELKRAMNHLRPDQSVNVLLCGDGHLIPAFKDSPRPATDELKQEIYTFIENSISAGASDIEPAMKEAIRQRPDIIRVLWNGYCEPKIWPKTLSEIRMLNAGKHIPINTSLIFASDSDINASQRLFDLADQNNGVCLDKKGKKLAARPVPLSPPKPAAPPALNGSPPDDKPSIFQEQ